MTAQQLFALMVTLLTNGFFWLGLLGAYIIWRMWATAHKDVREIGAQEALARKIFSVLVFAGSGVSLVFFLWLLRTFSVPTVQASANVVADIYNQSQGIILPLTPQPRAEEANIPPGAIAVVNEEQEYPAGAPPESQNALY